jgi:RNA polymerase sigma factor (sigma-70 family)
MSVQESGRADGSRRAPERLPTRLTPAAERRLVLAARESRGREREKLIEAFLPSIAGVARLYRSSPAVSRRELMQEGVVGLLRALERFDPALGTPFWAYASWWVRQAMQHLVAELSGPMVLSDRALRQLARVKQTERECAQKHGRQPTTTELVSETGLRRTQVDNLIAAERTPSGLDDPVGEGGGTTVADQLADPHAEDPHEHAVRQWELEQLGELLEELTARERWVVRARFGLDGSEHKLCELAGRLGVSAERVRQIEQAALAKMRDCCPSPWTA